MDISIVTPVYNEPRIRQTLDSILSQNGVPNLEVIVVDGCSTDETPEVIDEYSDEIDILVQEPDEGVYDAMNKGINRATGDVVGILNADDRYEGRNVLQTVLETFESTGADVCYGNLVYVNTDNEIVRYWESGEYRRNRFFWGWMPPHPTVFVRREIYDQYNLFDLDYSIAADYELLLRYLMRHGLSAAYIDKVLVRMATGGKSNKSVSNILEANREVYRAWQKNGLSGGIQVPFIKPLRKIPQYFRRWERKDQ